MIPLENYRKRSLPEKQETPPSKKPPADALKRLPIPCPVPTVFSKHVETALHQNQLSGLVKLRMLRESAFFFFGFCPSPKPYEYLAMAKSLCDNYPQLKDIDVPDGMYWVNTINLCDLLSVCT